MGTFLQIAYRRTLHSTQWLRSATACRNTPQNRLELETDLDSLMTRMSWSEIKIVEVEEIDGAGPFPPPAKRLC